MNGSGASRRMERWGAVGVACALLACAGELGLPAPPTARVTPRITALEPSEGLGLEVIEIIGSGFDPVPDNNEVRFVDGLSARGFACTARGFLIRVPLMLWQVGPVSVTTPAGTSAASPMAFRPLGYGYPVQGSSVAQLRLRHRPVGVVNNVDAVVIASTLHGQLAVDAGRSEPLEAQPVAFARVSRAQAMVSVEGLQGGRVLLVDALAADTIGRIEARSDWSAVVERFVLSAGADGVADTIGVDANLRWFRTSWRRQGERLEPVRTLLEASSVLGAARAPDGAVHVVAKGEGSGDAVLVRLGAEGSVVMWRPNPEEDEEAVGPLAVVAAPEGTFAALALADGDFVFVNLGTGAVLHQLAVSFDPAAQLVAGYDPGKVIASKRGDGEVFQYDVRTGHLDWSAWVPGAPAAIDVASWAPELVVANEEQNMVDVFSTVDGTARGRISFQLGLGAEGGGQGGVVASFSYSESCPVPASERFVDVLARRNGFVLRLDPSALEVLAVAPLAPEAGAAMRLLTSPDWKTLVLHRSAVGLLPRGGEAERVLVPDLASPPIAATFAGPDLFVVGAAQGFELFRWADGEMVRLRAIDAAAGETLEGLLAARGDLFAVWRSAAGWFVDRYSRAALDGAGSATRTTLPEGYADFLGGLELVGPVEGAAPLDVCAGSEPWTPDGVFPALAFGRSPSGAAALLSFKGGATPVVEALPATRPAMGAATPNRRLVSWAELGAGEPTVRLLRYDPSQGFYSYATYHLGSRAAAPGFEPSGEWMFVPLPGLDEIDVFE